MAPHTGVTSDYKPLAQSELSPDDGCGGVPRAAEAAPPRVIWKQLVLVAIASLLFGASLGSLPHNLSSPPADTANVQQAPSQADAIARPEETSACPSLAYDAGSWERKAHVPATLRSMDEFYKFMNVTTCKIETLRTWNLGLQDSKFIDIVPPFDQRIAPMSYEWVPHSSCHLREPTMVEKLQALIDGPLLLVGDSRVRQHVFQLSCELGDHVTSACVGDCPPEHSTDTRVVRAKPHDQHLLLDPESPLLPQLDLPAGFSFDQPLVTFLMVYIPLGIPDMQSLPVDHHHLPSKNPRPAYPRYDFPENETLAHFLGESPWYKTMLFSTGAHFSPVVFPDATVPEILAFERASLRKLFGDLSNRMRSDQRVLVRAAAAGSVHTSNAGPLAEVDRQGAKYNYEYSSDQNLIQQEETELLRDPRFTWLGMDRLARLRPDSHLPGDNLHIAIGTGVFEAFSRRVDTLLYINTAEIA